MINYDESAFVVCVSHIDLDGEAAAAVVKKKFPSARVYYNDYGAPVHPDVFTKGSKLYVTDFSLQDHEFTKAKSLGIEVVWLDHHMDRVRELEDKGFSFPGRRMESECGAMLTWKFLFPAREVPDAIKLVDDIDRWQFKDPRTKAFAAGMEMYMTRVSMRKCYIWDMLLSDDEVLARTTLERVVKDGERIVAYRERRNRIMCKELSFKTEFQGKPVLCAAVKLHNSMFFDSVHAEVKSQVDAMCLIQYNAWGRCYKGTFYSPDEVKEVLPMAKALGGGGHPCAAGFRSKYFPFRITVDKSQAPSIDVIVKAYNDLNKSRRDLIVDRAASKSDRIALSGSVYNTRFLGHMTACINHPYMTELIRAFPYFTDMRDSNSGEIVDVIAGWVLTRSGLYRNGVHFIDAGTTMPKEEFLANVKTIDPSITDIYVEEVGGGSQVYWFYSEKQVVPVLSA